MTNTVVGSGIKGGLTTSGRPSQKGDVQLWVPKQGTHKETTLSGEVSLNVQNGLEAAGVDSSEVICTAVDLNIDAGLADSDTTGPIADPAAVPVGQVPDLIRYAPLSSNPARSGNVDHLKASIGHGEPSSSNCRRGKSDLQGMDADGHGYGHMDQIEADYGLVVAGNTTVMVASGVDATVAKEGSEPNAKHKANSGTEESKGVKSWKNLFLVPEKTSGQLQFFKPHMANGKLVAKPPVEAVNEGIDMWKGCLVGQFLDKRLPFPVVRSLVNRLWGKNEIPDISTTENGLFFFRFRDLEAWDWVMESGPWHLAGRPFILRAWRPGMDMLDIQLSTIPIWVKFFNIPLEYWTSTSLGYIASTVGIPLHLDALTENQSRLSFARICVEVGADCEFPKSILLDRGNGKYSNIRIEYPWIPQCCSECKRFGHSLVNCQVKKGPGNNNTNAGCVSESEKLADEKMDMQDTGGTKLLSGDTSDLIDVSGVEDRAASNYTATNAAEVSREANDNVNQPKLHGNAFACLAQVEEEDEETAISIVDDFSDSSPILDTFKQIKRVDELDFTPVPISRKKLKKLKKRSLAPKQDPVDGGNVQHPNG